MSDATSHATTSSTASPTSPIRLMVSDVDGTLVNREKAVSPATVEAVAKLRAAGCHFAAVSSRPPRGMTLLIEPLRLEILGGFNGSCIVRPDLSVIEQHVVPLAAARTAIEVMSARGADIWVFADNEWYVTNPANPYVARETRTVAFDAIAVSDFGDSIGRAGKIVGTSSDYDMLAQCEADLQAMLGDTASAHRSQHYYLDITHPGTDKGHAVEVFARHFGVALDEVAVIGDMANDLPMFAKAGLAIAMGNATDAVKAKADAVTATNAEDGVAQAIARFVLPRAPGA
ncbi:Cof-type HAD-IIB family hydrolase [Ancylobacter sp. 6x-1]|uniref:Cof-type HAD-IIB family hydrolase n=1 Tax=Ancylobacter crimeensis TaxID=2579147 RepID=A0ABT0DCH0_9HYPH|nr:Cof-type HAD-IIB family hydrolase [Ancylobacter crimeensis]MCK0197447.1 Cof-type HAD-IIB family hydrolase [Ancylobacter crimeensis]